MDGALWQDCSARACSRAGVRPWSRGDTSSSAGGGARSTGGGGGSGGAGAGLAQRWITHGPIGTTNVPGHPLVAADAQGNVILAGAFTGTLDFGAGVMSASSDYDPAIFVVKLDAAGGILWTETLGAGSSYSSVDMLLVDPSGSIVLAGAFQSSIDFGAGSLTSPPDGGGYLARLDPDGHALWSREYPVLTPWLDAAGQPRWSKVFAGNADIDRVAFDGAGNLLVTGLFRDSIDFGGAPAPSDGLGWDLFVAELGP